MKLPQFTVSGSARSMGEQYGEQCRDLIHGFINIRESAVANYMKDAGRSDGGKLLEAGAACFELVKTFDPDGYEEHLGIAAGSGLDPVRLFTATNMTDVRDIITLPGDPLVLEDEGCTAALVPSDRSESGTSLQGQTWDLNGPDVDYVVALHRIPDNEPETWTVTCAGCQTLMGMNEHAVTVGTTNLKTRGARVGVPYLSVLHLALKQSTRAAASDVMRDAPVAGSHTYWTGDAEGAIEWERTPYSADARTTETGPVARSNHCLIESNRELEAVLGVSSIARFERMQALLEASNDHTVQSLAKLFEDRSDGRLSINRFAEDESGATTNAVVAFDPAERVFLACRGTADQGEWVRLEFERERA